MLGCKMEYPIFLKRCALLIFCYKTKIEFEKVECGSTHFFKNKIWEKNLMESEANIHCFSKFCTSYHFLKFRSGIKMDPTRTSRTGELQPNQQIS